MGVIYGSPMEIISESYESLMKIIETLMNKKWCVLKFTNYKSL